MSGYRRPEPMIFEDATLDQATASLLSYLDRRKDGPWTFIAMYQRPDSVSRRYAAARYWRARARRERSGLVRTFYATEAGLLPRPSDWYWRLGDAPRSSNPWAP